MHTRSIRCICSLAAIGFVWLLATYATASAASILNLELIPDGSAEPPGDRLEFVPLLAPDEQEATCEIRAYVVSADRKQTQAVQSTGQHDCDADGKFLISRAVKQSKEPTKVSIVVPYGELKLEKGSHWIGYCVAIKCGEKPPIEVATRLSQVTVTDQPRNQMKLQQRAAKPSIETKKQNAVVGSETGRKDISRQTFSIPVPTFQSETKTSDVTVNIPGGFQRHVPPPETSRGDDTDYGVRDEVAASAVALVPLSQADTADKKVIYFATNRAPAKNSTPDNPQFSGEVGTRMVTGRCVVNIPVQHQVGELEQPSFWRSVDTDKDFLVESTQIIPGNQIFKEATSKDLLLYIHGFNTEFDFAVLRAAQLRYDLKFPGNAMAVSWPSAGSMLAYAQDREHAEQSASQVADLLQSLITNARESSNGGQPRKIHLLAHSMGNHVLLNAIYQLQTRNIFPEKEKLFGQVVLAAPDVGAIEFNNLLPYVIQHAERVTYYYCTHDAALAASRQKNQYEPVGLMAFFQNGLDTINTDAVGTSFMYHGYYASARQVLSDVGLLVNQQLAPESRLPPLATANTVFGHPHWSFAAQLLTAAKP